MAAEPARIFVTDDPSCMYENVLDSVVKSINEENVDEYSKNFVSFTKTDRLNAALFFLKHQPTLFVFEKHILQETDSKVELAISYQISCDTNQRRYKFSSIIVMKKIGDSWKFSKEKIITSEITSSKNCSSCSDQQNDNGLVCFGGQCEIK